MAPVYSKEWSIPAVESVMHIIDIYQVEELLDH